MGLLPRQPGQATSPMSQIRQMLSGNPMALANSMLANNPKFAEFVRMNQGRPIEDVAREAGVDMDMVRKILGQ